MCVCVERRRWWWWWSHWSHAGEWWLIFISQMFASPDRSPTPPIYPHHPSVARLSFCCMLWPYNGSQGPNTHKQTNHPLLGHTAPQQQRLFSSTFNPLCPPPPHSAPFSCSSGCIISATMFAKRTFYMCAIKALALSLVMSLFSSCSPIPLCLAVCLSLCVCVCVCVHPQAESATTAYANEHDCKFARAINRHSWAISNSNPIKLPSQDIELLLPSWGC